MTIFEFAIQMEKDGEAFYRELANKAENPGLKKIFSSLADDEVMHMAAFKKIADGMAVESSAKDVVAGIKNIFADMKAGGNTDVTAEISQQDAYKKARDMEKKSYLFYEEKAAEVEDATQKELLLAFAEEERQHYAIVESVLDFVAQPDKWLEDAEFVHLDDF